MKTPFKYPVVIDAMKHKPAGERRESRHGLGGGVAVWEMVSGYQYCKFDHRTEQGSWFCDYFGEKKSRSSCHKLQNYVLLVQRTRRGPLWHCLFTSASFAIGIRLRMVPLTNSHTFQGHGCVTLWYLPAWLHPQSQGSLINFPCLPLWGHSETSRLWLLPLNILFFLWEIVFKILFICLFLSFI